MMPRLTIFLLLKFFMLSSITSYGQEESEKGDDRTMHIGVEQDVLPYILKGFIGTAWVGVQKIRVRVSYAEANTPAFVLQDGLKKDRTKAVGISAEYFFKDDFKGLWFGPGIGYWNNEVITVASDKALVKSWVFSLGGGYNIFIWKGLYTSPWLALHTRVAGDYNQYIGAIKYAPMIFTPEASVKLGWKF